MAVDLPRLARVLEASLDPAQNKQGIIPILILQQLYGHADPPV